MKLIGSGSSGLGMYPGIISVAPYHYERSQASTLSTLSASQQVGYGENAKGGHLVAFCINVFQVAIIDNMKSNHPQPLLIREGGLISPSTFRLPELIFSGYSAFPDKIVENGIRNEKHVILL
jgi:hypothetical protein